MARSMMRPATIRRSALIDRRVLEHVRRKTPGCSDLERGPQLALDVMAQFAGCSKRSVQRSIGRLIDARCIARTGGGGRNNPCYYKLLVVVERARGQGLKLSTAEELPDGLNEAPDGALPDDGFEHPERTLEGAVARLLHGEESLAEAILVEYRRRLANGSAGESERVGSQPEESDDEGDGVAADAIFGDVDPERDLPDGDDLEECWRSHCLVRWLSGRSGGAGGLKLSWRDRLRVAFPGITVAEGAVARRWCVAQFGRHGEKLVFEAEVEAAE